MVKTSRILGIISTFAVLNFGFVAYCDDMENLQVNTDSGVPYIDYNYEKGYELIPTEDNGINTITQDDTSKIIKYYDSATGVELQLDNKIDADGYTEVVHYETTPQKYEVNFTRTEYGDKNSADEIKYYKFELVDGKTNLVNTTESEYDIKYYVNSVRQAEKLTSYPENSNINFDFIGNNSSEGEAIYNTGTLGNITGDFLENPDGAIYNTKGVIGDITGNFINNSAASYGGAIYNFNAEIGDIKGDFINNSSSQIGGAILNNTQGTYTTTINNITGNFIGNKSKDGGAISNYSYDFWSSKYQSHTVIGDITGNFINNEAIGGKGGAIYNFVTSKFSSTVIGNITGDFIGNKADSAGAIANMPCLYDGNAIIGNITGNFIDNKALTSGAGAIINQGTIGIISGSFINNTAAGVGGAISNSGGKIQEIKADFISNGIIGSEYTFGGAISNNMDVPTIGNITGNFINNYIITTGEYGAQGGAILNNNTGASIGNIKGDFVGNHIIADNKRAIGGAIINWDGAIIGSIDGNFLNNSATGLYAWGGAIANRGNEDWGYPKTGNITGVYIANYVHATGEVAYGGAIYNTGYIGDIDEDGNTVGGIFNSSFYNNYAKAEIMEALGGAIYTESDLNIIADQGNSVFSGNYTESNGIKNNNAIYVNSSNAVLNLHSRNNGSIYLYDNIDGQQGYTLKLNGDDSSKIVFNNDINNAAITLDNTNVFVKESSNIANAISLDVRSGNFNVNNFGSTVVHLSNFANTGSINIANVDVDLINKSMGRLYADSYGDTTGIINVQKLTLLNDSIANSTSVLFADKAFADSVKYTGSSTVAYSPIYTYNVQYAQNPEDMLGYFMFTRGSGSSNPSDNFNPAVLPTPVATQSGAYTTQMQTFNYAFQHSENFMNIPSLDRLVMKTQNRYAMSPTGDATDVGTFSPLFQKEHEHNGFWVKPYASFERVPLENGPKVSNINYGTLIGYDTEIRELKHGWDQVLTGYVGYNGSSQRYRGVDTYQNGGLVGITNTLYKGNFFNATTLSVGASVGNTTTMYGHEDYTMLLSGIGNKMGYNIEFKDGLFILQPLVLLSYTFVNTFDYTNAAGVRIDSDPMHAIQLAPGIKFIMNTKNGWQPYLAVNMVWNILDKQKVMANDVRLPEMSIKPYVEYGMGIQRCFKQDNVTAFAQAMVHSGGRNGVSLTAGLRFKVGKDSHETKAQIQDEDITIKVKNKKLSNKNDKTAKTPRIKLFGWSLLSEK